MNRLLTPKFEEAIKDYPLYSQDGKERNAVCVAIFTIGNHVCPLKIVDGLYKFNN